MARNTSKDAETVTAIKATGRGGKYNFPCTNPPEDPEVVRAVLSECVHWYEVGSTPANTTEEVQQRSNEFIDYCIQSGERLTVEKYCLALGHPRKVIWEWEQANDARSNVIKRTKDIIAAYDASLVSMGKLNPVPYIFRAKNYYGMKDQQDVVLTPNSPLQTDTNPIDIASKYDALPED